MMAQVPRSIRTVLVGLGLLTIGVCLALAGFCSKMHPAHGLDEFDIAMGLIGLVVAGCGCFLWYRVLLPRRGSDLDNSAR